MEGLLPGRLSMHQESKNIASQSTSPTTHKVNRGSLWIHGWNTPCWLQEEVRGTELEQSVKVLQGEDGKYCMWKKALLSNQEMVFCDASEEEEEEEELSNLSSEKSAIVKEEKHPLLLAGISNHQHFSQDACLALLNTFAKQKDLHRGSRVHANIIKHGLLEKDPFMCSTLVNLYAKCGALAKAQEVFNELLVQDIVSWNALIAGYVKECLFEEALKCFKQMLQEGVFPDAVTFSCILKACGSIGFAEKGEEIHAQVVREGLLEKNVVVANSLVDMYVKCGLIEKAREVFEKLSIRDVVSWNTLIAGYVQHTQGEEALDCFQRMQSDGFSPNAVTFVCLLKACGSLGAAVKAEEIRSEIMKEGLLQSNVVLGTALVDMYATCGLLEKAQDVFNELSIRNAVSWSALISGYVQHGHCEEALQCFDQMQLEGFSPNAATFACILKACGSLGALDKGQSIHAQVVEAGFLRESIVVVNALIDMYAKCGLLGNAQQVFDELPTRDVISWNVLIAGYAQHGHGEKALRCFEHMQIEGFSPDAVTFVCMLKACGNTGAAHKGQKLHAEIIREGLLEMNILIANSLVDMYAKCGLLAEAQKLFDKLSTRDVVSWSALIAGYVHHMKGQEALDCFNQMQHEGFSPNSVTFLCILKACGSIGAAENGQELHSEIVKHGLVEENMAVGSALVDLYANCGMLAEAQGVFDKLPVQDVVLWNALIAGYALLGDCEVVFKSFDTIVVGEGIEPDLVTYTILLNVCSHRGLLNTGQQYFESMCAGDGIIPTLKQHTCMVDLFGRAGHIDEAIAVIMKMPCFADLTVWHTILGACHKWGNLELGRLALAHVAHLDEHDTAAYISMSNTLVAYLYE